MLHDVHQLVSNFANLLIKYSLNQNNELKDAERELQSWVIIIICGFINE